MRKYLNDPTTWLKGLIGLILIGLVTFAAFLGSSSEQAPAATTSNVSATSPGPTPSPLTTTTIVVVQQPPAPPEPSPTQTTLPPMNSPITVTTTSELTAAMHGSAESPPIQVDPIPIYSYEVINTFPHDPNAWTQGLIYTDDVLYESTGRYGYSSLRKVDLDTGQPLQIIQLPQELYGEGMTILEDKVFQITWKNQVGLIYNKESFDLLQTFSYPTEGWGITHDGSRLIMSDGTANLYFLDPKTLTEIDRIEVFDDKGPVVRLNELEYISGEIYANVWQTDLIARITPETGQVTGWIRLGGLLNNSDRQQPVDVLNGIAYDAAGDRLFVTGKLWPKLFEIRLVQTEE